MKEKLFVTLLCLNLLLPLIPAHAQEAQAEEPAPQEQAASDSTAPDNSQSSGAQTKPAPTAAPQSITLGGGTVKYWINKIIGYVSQIGALFGKTTGLRIGGTSVSAIAAFLIGKKLQDNAPGWVSVLFYLAGGTMAAGGSANIVQLVERFLG
jgi:hypothetical protein